MANHKRKKRKTFRFGTCPGGLKCHYDVSREYRNNSKHRLDHKAFRKPQMYDDEGRMVNYA